MKTVALLLCALFLTNTNYLVGMSISSSSSSPDKKECQICFSKKNNNKFTMLLCGHGNYCTKCLDKIIKNGFKDKSSLALRCPQQACKKEFEESDIRAITKKGDVAASFSELKSNEYLRRCHDTKQCPTPGCSYTFINDRHIATQTCCPNCLQSYCALCLTCHDKNAPCSKTQPLDSVDEPLREWLNKNTKPCPKCRTNIEKDIGCDHLKCAHCTHEFCWHCNAPTVDAQGKKHPSYCSMIGSRTPQRVAPRVQDANGTSYCSCLAIVCIALIWPSKFIPHLFRHQPSPHPPAFLDTYPHFEGLDSTHNLVIKHCPIMLEAPQDQVMQDITPACDALETLKKDYNTHHQNVLNVWNKVIVQNPTFTPNRLELISTRQKNLDHIDEAIKKCGCQELLIKKNKQKKS